MRCRHHRISEAANAGRLVAAVRPERVAGARLWSVVAPPKRGSNIKDVGGYIARWRVKSHQRQWPAGAVRTRVSTCAQNALHCRFRASASPASGGKTVGVSVASTRRVNLPWALAAYKQRNVTDRKNIKSTIMGAGTSAHTDLAVTPQVPASATVPLSTGAIVLREEQWSAAEKALAGLDFAAVPSGDIIKIGPRCRRGPPEDA